MSVPVSTANSIASGRRSIGKHIVSEPKTIERRIMSVRKNTASSVERVPRAVAGNAAGPMGIADLEVMATALAADTAVAKGITVGEVRTVAEAALDTKRVASQFTQGIQQPGGPIALTGLFIAGWFFGSSSLHGAIDTAWLEQPWPRQHVRELEVGRYPVRWRQHIDATQGLLAGVAFTAPLDRERVWELATAVTDLQGISPHIVSVALDEDAPERQVVRLELQVLWKRVALRFEIERNPPSAVRFQFSHDQLGTYRGVCTFAEAGGGTRIAASTQLQPSRPRPLQLILALERIVLLRGVRGFLERCEQEANRYLISHYGTMSLLWMRSSRLSSPRRRCSPACS